jgi:hypothetical protein
MQSSYQAIRIGVPWLLITLITISTIPGTYAQGLQDVGILQAIDQFLVNTGQIGRAVVGLFAGVEGLGGIGKECHVEWDILRSLYTFELRVESMVMVLRTIAQYNYVCPLGIFRCAEVPDAKDPDKILELCKLHNRGVTVANASAQYILLCAGMALVSVLCLVKKPFTEDTYFSATVAFVSVLYGGSVRVCRTEYTARRTVMELEQPAGWPSGDTLRSMISGTGMQLHEVPGLFELELGTARHSMRRGIKAITILTLVQVISVILWLGGSPWSTKWIAMGITVVLGVTSIGANYFVATASYLMRIEARDARGVRECIAAVWLMLNGERFSRRMHHFLQGARPDSDTSSVAQYWWRAFESCTRLIKVVVIINMVVLGCGPFSTDLAAKIGFLAGMMLWVLAIYLNGGPF